MKLNDIADGLDHLASQYGDKVANKIIFTKEETAYHKGVMFGLMRAAKLLRESFTETPGFKIES